jgi:hypothetical protein
MQPLAPVVKLAGSLPQDDFGCVALIDRPV